VSRVVVELPPGLGSYFAATHAAYLAYLGTQDPTTRALVFPALSHDPMRSLELEAGLTDLRSFEMGEVAATAQGSLAGSRLTADEDTLDAWLKVASNVRRISLQLTGRPERTCETVLGAVLHLLATLP
jgi:hypothetical protein